MVCIRTVMIFQNIDKNWYNNLVTSLGDWLSVNHDMTHADHIHTLSSENKLATSSSTGENEPKKTPRSKIWVYFSFKRLESWLGTL